MSRPKLKGYTVRKKKDCARWELLIHPDRRLGLPMTYGGLYRTREEAEREGRRVVGVGNRTVEGDVPW